MAPRDGARAHIALTCASDARVGAGDVLRVAPRSVETNQDFVSDAFECVVERDASDASDASARTFEVRASGTFARAFVAFGALGRVMCVGALDDGAARTRDDGSSADVSTTKTLVCRCEMMVEGVSRAVVRGMSRAARITTFGHLSTRDAATLDAEAMEAAASDERPFCGVLGCQTHVGDRRATLSAVLEELRPEMRREHATIKAATPGYLCAGDLPEDVVERILGFLDPKCASTLACTCRGFRSRVEETSPGLALTLHPHQRAALGWMRRRERARLPPILDPLWKPIDCEDDRVLWLHTLKGELSDHHPDVYEDSQGGMLCDEPGLGKTVTALALVLARRGWRPSPPIGYTARKMESCWYYEDTNSGGAGGYGSPAVMAAVPTLDAETPAITPMKTSAAFAGSSSRGNSSGLRRSKRSVGNTPVGYFASVCKNGLDGTMSRSAKRSKLEEKQAYEALAAATTVEVPDWQTRLECSAHSAPIGFIARTGLKEDSARLARNTSYFESILRNCVVYVGRAATCDVVDYILENTEEVSHAMPLSMPLFRRNSDQPPIFRALGLEPYTGVGKLENAIPYAPPGSATEDLILDKQALHDAIRVVDNRGSSSEPMRVWLSSATLIIIPSVLIEHWLQQISFCTWNITGEGVPRVAVLDKPPKVDGFSSVYKTEGSLEPVHLNDLAHVDAKDLANDFDIVIMPINRLSTEFSKVDTPILRILWQRVILDEGHQLGASLAVTAKLSVACALKAHARWLMTGTPTPTTLKGAGTAHLQPLLGFLRQPPYGTSAGLWTTAVQRPLEGRDRFAQADAVVRLGDVLRRCMVRTCKSHIELPPLKRTTSMLQFSDVHADSYNDLVAFVKRNLLLADWGDPNHTESLLNPKNVREAAATVTNLREAACVVGQMPITCSSDEFDETILALMQLLKERGFGDEERKARVRRVSPMLMQCKGTCDLCLHKVLMPLVTPCAHILCCGCVMRGPPKGKTLNGKDVEDERVNEPELPPGVHRAPRGCPVCGSAYFMEEDHDNNLNPVQEVPKDLIELQPKLEQHSWKVDESRGGDGVYAQGESSKVDHLLAELRKIGAAVSAEIVKQQDDRDAFFAREANGMSENTPGWSGRLNANAQAREGTTQQGRRRKRMLDAATPLRLRDFTPTAPPPKKCIIYSDFRPHLDTIDLALYGARVPHESITRIGQSRYDREQALKNFKNDPDCAVLLLNRAAAEGLDLSFVSYVFLMEPLSNMSLEQQVISRAHRMGQKDTVRVKVFAMANTAEEIMLDVQSELARNGTKMSLDSLDATTRHDVTEDSEADVAPTVVAESLSRRRILERLELVPSKSSDEAAARKAKAVTDHFERIRNGGDGRVLGNGKKKGEEEEARWMREALEASARELEARASDGGVLGIGSPQSGVPNREEIAEDDESEAWTMRVRDPNDGGAVKDFTLPNAGKTTVSAMRARISSRIGASIDAFVVRCGFPPRALTDRDLCTPIALLGIQANDLINLQAENAPDMHQADATIVTTTAKPKLTKAARAKALDTSVLDAKVQRRLKTVLKQSETSTEMMLQDPDEDPRGAGAGGGAAGAMSIDLLRAAEGGKRAANDASIRSLQTAFQAMVEERAKESEGNMKCGAARSGAVEYSTLADGRLVVKYEAVDISTGRRQKKTDCVQDIPAAMLPIVLALVAADADTNAAARANLSPPSMAVASPRVFWAVVRHGGVGPHLSFPDALKKIAPKLKFDWHAIDARERRANPRYADYDTSH